MMAGLTALLCAGCCRCAPAQTPTSVPAAAAEAAASSTVADRPLPDINSLMGQVEAQQKASLKTAKQYIFRSLHTEQDLDSHGTVKKTSTEERENFWVNGVFISKLLSRDGKPLSADELNKQSERIDKRIAEVREREAKAAAESPQKKRDTEEVTFARFLELGAFSNPRRVTLNGRETIAVDYNGDPKAKTRSLLEGAIHDLAGTVWVDEQDHALVRVEGHFFDDFKIGGGLLADIHKGSTFSAEWTKVNDEVWLPASFAGRGSARIALLINHSGAVESRESDYRKFRASSTILPGAIAVQPDTPATGSASH
jgi:hypothetical protein